MYTFWGHPIHVYPIRVADMSEIYYENIKRDIPLVKYEVIFLPLVEYAFSINQMPVFRSDHIPVLYVFFVVVEIT